MTNLIWSKNHTGSTVFTKLDWTMVLQYNIAKNQLHLISEEAVGEDTKDILLNIEPLLVAA